MPVPIWHVGEKTLNSRIVTTLNELLFYRLYQKRVQQQNAIRVLQRNGLAWLKLRNWQWWRLFTKVKPLLEVCLTRVLSPCGTIFAFFQVTNSEVKINQKEEELKKIRDAHEAATLDLRRQQEQLAQHEERERQLREDLMREAEERAEADDYRQRLQGRANELEVRFSRFVICPLRSKGHLGKFQSNNR